MAVIQKPWELHQVLFGDVEVWIFLYVGVILGFGPSYSEHCDCGALEKSCVFPSHVVLGY